MEEDEEYSKSECTQPSDDQQQADDATTAHNNEVVADAPSYEHHSDSHKHSSGIADAVLEKFSIDGNIERFAKLTKWSENTVAYIMAAINIVLGVLCITITDIIAECLPFIVSGVMIVLGITQLVVAIVKHEYRHSATNFTASSIIVIALGVMILYQGLESINESAITFISIIWGILGLFECAHAFNHAFERIANSERGIYFLLKGLVEGVIAFLLLYNPAGHEIHHVHIIVFGANLIIDAITAVPQVKIWLKTK